jgi:glycolate oxidase FAD binding subunit
MRDRDERQTGGEGERALSDSSVSAQFLACLGPEGVGSETDRQTYCVDGQEPKWVVFPRSVEQVSWILKTASEHSLAVIAAGNGSFLHLGAPPKGYDVALSLRYLDRIVDYQPTDMTVTVEGGLVLSRLQEVLRQHGQWLPLDPPLAERATMGGIIAANLSGPARLSQGTVRDFLIGLKVVQADGVVVKGGGRVVKNVAGYDFPKLYCGSLGTLGIVVEATLKVRPRPEEEQLLSLPFSSAEEAMGLVSQITGSELQPLFLELLRSNFLLEKTDVSSDSCYTLFIGLAGVAEEIAYEKDRIRAWAADRAGALKEWEKGEQERVIQRLRDFPVQACPERRGEACFARTREEAVLSCKASLLPTQVAPFMVEVEEEATLRDFSAQFLAHAGSGVVYSRFYKATTEDAGQACPEPGRGVRRQTFGQDTAGHLLSLVEWLRVITKKLGGYIVVELIDPTLKEQVDVWGHVGGALLLMKGVKEKLDPKGILSPGRFVGGI